MAVRLSGYLEATAAEHTVMGRPRVRKPFRSRPSARRAPWQARMLFGVLALFCALLLIAPLAAYTDTTFVEDAIRVTLGALVGFLTGLRQR